MSMTELRNDWLIGYYALGREKFCALIGYYALVRDKFCPKTVSTNSFSSERVDSEGLYMKAPGNGLLVESNRAHRS